MSAFTLVSTPAVTFTPALALETEVVFAFPVASPESTAVCPTETVSGGVSRNGTEIGIGSSGRFSSLFT